FSPKYLPLTLCDMPQTGRPERVVPPNAFQPLADASVRVSAWAADPTRYPASSATAAVTKLCFIADVDDSGLFEQRFLQGRGRLEEEHQHGAALRRDRRVPAAFGADDEVAGGAFAFVVLQRAFEHEGLLQVLVHMRRDAGARLELRQDGQHVGLG